MSNYYYYGQKNVLECISKRLADAGFSQLDVVEDVQFVLTYCTNLTSLEDLYFGDNGLVQKMAPGSVVVDISPSTPSLSSEISAIATISEIMMVSAPMVVKDKFSTDPFARENISCFVASEDKIDKKTNAFLEAIFGEIQPVSSVGATQLARAANTIQTSSEIVSSIEAYSLAEAAKSSLSLDVSDYSAYVASKESSFAIDAVKEKRFKGPYTVEMVMGELSAAMMSADDFDLILPQTEAAFHLFELLAVVGGVDLALPALAFVYEGENSKDAAKLGIDWERMSNLYPTSDEDDIEDDNYDDAIESFADDDFDFDDSLY